MPGLTYLKSGVDLNAGNELVRRITTATKRTSRPEVLSSLGGFAAMASLPAKYRDPVLVPATDGVGTKLKLAIDHNRHDEVGQDLVAMCVNDVLVNGAEPFLFLDYYATAKLDLDVAERVVVGIAHGCELAGCALVGGETAEMPGFYQEGDYDLAGFCIGIVERKSIITGQDISVGDRLIGLASSGPHSNGYSLIRHIIEDQQLVLDAPVIDQLLAPTRIYAKAIQQTLTTVDIKGMSHITGGGFTENLPRMFGSLLAADIDLDSWTRPSVFQWLQQSGKVDEAEMLQTFNCGIGYILCVSPEFEAQAMKALADAGENPTNIGEIVAKGSNSKEGHLVLDNTGHKLG